MSVIRAFIAIELPREVQNCLDQVSQELQKRLENVPVKWVSVEKIHVTLKFLGNVSIKNMDILKNTMQQVISRHKSFEVSIGGLGAFPKIHNPRVIWVGLESPTELASLQQDIETETSKLGYSQEKRPFSPHLTLGRVSRNALSKDMHVIADVLASYRVGFLGVANIKEVHLFQSQLKPQGAIYTRLFTVPLVD